MKKERREEKGSEEKRCIKKDGTESINCFLDLKEQDISLQIFQEKGILQNMFKANACVLSPMNM